MDGLNIDKPRMELPLKKE